MEEFIATTTDQIDGFTINRYIGIVTGEVVLGINFMKDWVASLKDKFGGRVFDYENAIKEGEKKAILTMIERAQKAGANAVVGVKFDHEVLSPRGKGTVIAVMASGTAVSIKEQLSPALESGPPSGPYGLLGRLG